MGNDPDNYYETDYSTQFSYDGYSFVSVVMDVDDYSIEDVVNILVGDGYDANALFLYEYPYAIYRKAGLGSLIDKMLIQMRFGTMGYHVH